MDHRTPDDDRDRPTDDTMLGSPHRIERSASPALRDLDALLRSLEDVSGFVDPQAHGF